MQQIFPRGLCEQSQTALDLACFNGDQARPGYAEARAAYLAAAQAEIDRRAGR